MFSIFFRKNHDFFQPWLLVIPVAGAGHSNKKAVLSQRRPRDARYISRL